MTDELREALEDIYDSARYVVSGSLAGGTPVRAGYCRWCGAPPPDADHDHDMACPAAKAGYALDKPGYHDWMGALERLRRGSELEAFVANLQAEAAAKGKRKRSRPDAAERIGRA